MSVSIIVPHFNNWNLTHGFLSLLYRHTRGVEVVLVDDGSTEPDAFTGAMWWVQKSPLNVRLHRNDKNLGFGPANNIGAEIASGNILIFTQNDVIVQGDFVGPTVRSLEENPRALVGADLQMDETGWNTLPINGKPMIIPYLVGWYLACSADSWRELGGFDERYAPLDYEDIDLSLTAQYNGYDLIRLDLPLKHLFGRTTTKFYGERGRREITNRNREKFIAKWRDRLNVQQRSLEGDDRGSK